MNIKIRSERISDYSAIANVNYEAFLGWHLDNPYVSEPIIVDLLRHNDRFDPELSLVAELDGEIIGDVLFSPFKFIVLGTEQLGVVLAPIAVKPKNPIRYDIEKWTEKIGLHFIINTILSSSGEICNVVAGHHVQAHRKGVELGKKIYFAQAPYNADIVRN